MNEVTTVEVGEFRPDLAVSLNGHGYPQRMADHVVIVGFAESSRNDVPFDQPDTEFWGINRLHVAVEGRWTRWFQLHDLTKAHGFGTENEDTEHLTWLRAQTMPIYLRPEDIGRYGIPTEQPYPKAAILRDFAPYFTNTISWLIAMAIGMEFKAISVYGVDMAQDSIIHAEYRQQRPSCEYYLGLADGRGIRTYIPPSSDLLKTVYQYGFEDGDALTEKLQARLKELGMRKEQAKNEYAQTEANMARLRDVINQFDGAMQDVEYLLRNWAANPQEVRT